MIRLFAAIHITPGNEILDLVRIIQKDLAGENISWVKPMNMHITLKFFGDVQLANIAPIKRALEEVAVKIIPFDVSIEGFGIFGTTRFPKVIWLGLKSQSGLSDLYNAINQKLEPLGFYPDNLVFKPHLTFARIKEITTPDTLFQYETEYKDVVFQKNRIHNFSLFQSIFSPTGTLYKPLHSFHLKSLS